MTVSGVNLEGRVALVTGASRGIGAAIANRLAMAGVKVAINYHTSAAAAAAVMRSIDEAGGTAMLVDGDVSRQSDAENAVKSVVDNWGAIDILVNNAGINRDRLLLRMKPEDFDAVLDVNLRGAFLCTRYVMPHLIKQRHGRVINMSSVVGLSGNPGQAKLRRRQGRAGRVHQSGGPGRWPPGTSPSTPWPPVTSRPGWWRTCRMRNASRS